ncbi:MAG TPA: YbaK/EbsC family protein [Candidatus Dormibacteraeota bacterium]|nr:YbaK/EbsC family protein [Candidatus Dormibacteraeota bacterium]
MADAARSAGCTVDQIAKSIVFRRDGGGPPVVVVARGGQRVDEGKVNACLGATVRKADPEYVRATTGFAIGGVAPLGHTGPVTLLLDAGLLEQSAVWAAAGAPDAVVRLTPADLVRLTGAPPVDVTGQLTG